MANRKARLRSTTTTSRRWTKLLLLLFLLLVHGSRAVHGNEIAASQSAPALVYSFTPDACQQNPSIFSSPTNTATNTTTSNTTSLVRNPNTTICNRALGVESSSNLDYDSNNSNSSSHNNGDSFYITSTTSSSDLFRSIANAKQGISFSLWLKPRVSSFDGQSRPILTIGRRRGSSSQQQHPDEGLMMGGGLNPCDDNGIDLQLAQRDNHLELLYRTSESVFEPCQYYLLDDMIVTDSGGDGEQTISSSSSLPPLVPGKLVHVVVSLLDGKQQIFVNGQAFPEEEPLTQPFSNDLRHWHDDDYGLHLFSYDMTDSSSADAPADQQQDSVWRGTIYQLRIDVGNQSSSTVEEMLLDGLPPSLPFATNYTTLVHEDAELVAGSNPPEWYRDQAQVVGGADESNQVASRIPLLFESVDRQVHNLLLENDIYSNVWIENSTATTRSNNGPSFLTYVTKLPAVGSLYLTDGTKLEAKVNGNAAASLFPVLSGQVVYLPPLHAHSNKTEMGLLEVFASFGFCVAKTPIISSRQCDSATVRIVVEPVNDPPIASTGRSNVLPDAAVIVSEGPETLASPNIHLGGSDVDMDDFIQKVQITQPPLYGRLILSVGSFRKDGLRHGTDFLDLGNLIRGSDDPVYVKYIFDASLFPGALQGTNVRDSFRFRVADRHNRWSAEETVSIHIASTLEVANSNLHVVPEDSERQGNIELSAKDGSGYNRRVGFYIESIPLVGQGVLVDPSSTNDSLQAGMTLSDTIATDNLSEESSVPITFIPAPNFCTSHSKDASVQFQIRAVAFDNDDNDKLVSVSDPVTQFVQVECVMDALTLSGPNGTATTTSTATNFTYRLLQSTLRSSSDACRGASFDPALLLTNTTEDISTLCPRAAVFQGITVTSKDLHQQHVVVSVYAGASGYLTFNQQFWNLTRPLHGRRAMASGRVSFLAYPQDLTAIFSNLHFQSYRAGPDQVDIVLLYGNCTLEQTELWTKDSDNEAVSMFDIESTATCQVLRHSIPVLVERDVDTDHYTTTLVPSFPWQLLVCLLAYPMVYYIFVQVDAILCRTGEELDGDDDDDDDDTTTMVASPDEDYGNTLQQQQQDQLPDWIQHQTAEGDFYYENTTNGTVTWMAPIGERFVPFHEPEEEKEEIT